VHTTSVRSFGVLESLTIIAVCSGSSEAIDLLNSLRVIATGELWLPVGPGAEGMARRMGQRLRNTQWVASARTTINDVSSKYLAHHFFQWCVRCVPTNALDPLADATWLPRVRISYSMDPGLRMLAESLVNQFRLPGDNEIAAHAPVVPAPSFAPIGPAPAASALAPSQDAVQARLIARLRVIAKAKRFIEQFVRQWNAQKARAAAKPAMQDGGTPMKALASPIQSAAVTDDSKSMSACERMHVSKPIDEQATLRREPIRFAKRRSNRPLTSIPVSFMRANERTDIRTLISPDFRIRVLSPRQSLSLPMLMDHDRFHPRNGTLTRSLPGAAIIHFLQRPIDRRRDFGEPLGQLPSAFLNRKVFKR